MDDKLKNVPLKAYTISQFTTAWELCKKYKIKTAKYETLFTGATNTLLDDIVADFENIYKKFLSYINEITEKTLDMDIYNKFFNTLSHYKKQIRDMINKAPRYIKFGEDMFQILMNDSYFFNLLKRKIDNFDIDVSKKMDYINLYTHLYPNRIIENNIPKTIESCMENLNTMGDDELKDFINLIKTTIFWTDENSIKLYKELQERIRRKENSIEIKKSTDVSNINSENLENLKQECGELRSFLLDNYSMGYFNTAINNEELFNELNASEEYNYYIARYLPLFNGEIITPDKYKEIFKGGLKDIIYHNFRCCFNMMNGLRERRISPDVGPDEFLG